MLLNARLVGNGIIQYLEENFPGLGTPSPGWARLPPDRRKMAKWTGVDCTIGQRGFSVFSAWSALIDGDDDGVERWKIV